jgi:hypothetical protein
MTQTLFVCVQDTTKGITLHTYLVVSLQVYFVKITFRHHISFAYVSFSIFHLRFTIGSTLPWKVASPIPITSSTFQMVVIHLHGFPLS